MRVLLLHNRYRQPGGEDSVVASEEALLRSKGVDVKTVYFDNQGSQFEGLMGRARVALSAAWSSRSYETVRRLCEEIRPDIVHIHNFWMTLSPSAHKACSDARVPTVQTLHNFRLFCVNGLMMRKDQCCERCLGSTPWQGALLACYRDSHIASSAVAHMISMNRRRNTWDQEVGAFIALSNFSRNKFIEAGLPADKVLVKPNFVPDPGESAIRPSEANTVLFVGRLSREKGVQILLDAWSRSKARNTMRLVIGGTGPAEADLKKQCEDLRMGASVEFVGVLPSTAVLGAMQRSRALVMPSLWYENFPRVLVEAFACGRAAVVSDLGSMKEIVSRGGCGLTFEAGDAKALAHALDQVAGDPSIADRLGTAARKAYLTSYTPENNFEQLMAIYRNLLSSPAVRH